MVTDFFILLKQELVVVAIIFLLLFLKLGKERSNASILNRINLLLFLNLLIGFFWNKEGMLFNGMFVTGKLAVLEKNILSLAFLVISMQSFLAENPSACD
jgi:hypothetical protein